jgi:hypothetical protein
MSRRYSHWDLQGERIRFRDLGSGSCWYSPFSRRAGSITCGYRKLASLGGRAVQWRFPQSEPVAQLVEHRTFNAVVAGSSPARLTI